MTPAHDRHAKPQPPSNPEGVVEVSHVGHAKAQPPPPAGDVVEVSHAPDHAAVAEHARRQRGRVTLSQLQQAGRGRGAIRHDVQKGRLYRKHRRVYAVGHDAKAPWADHHAAFLAAGDDSVLGYRSGLEIWGALPPKPNRPVDVIAPTPRRHRAGMTVHRSLRSITLLE